VHRRPRPGRLLALWLALPAACDGGAYEGKPTGAVCPDDSTLTWNSFGRQFFADYCTRCHSSELRGAERQGAPNDHNFDTVQGVRAELDHTDESTAAGPDAVNTWMPLGAPTPTEDERRKLGEWLACGAP
jgi:uncharacterized membrane protein